MNATEIGALLAVCSSADNRKPNAEMVQFWHAALGDLDFVPCREAVVAHYQESTDWIMPAHIRGRVRRERRDRIEDDVIPMPPGLDPDDTAAYIRVIRAGRQALAEGRTLAEPTDLTRRSLRELGGPVRRVNELDDEERTRHAERTKQARAQALREQADRDAAAKAEADAKLTPVFTCDAGDPVCGRQATRVSADGRRPVCDDHAATRSREPVTTPPDQPEPMEVQR